MKLGDTSFAVPLRERQLFPDDYGISRIENLARRMHAPVKKGAVIRPDAGMGIQHIQLRMAPIWSPEKEVWQLWDCASEPTELDGAGIYFSGYYESPDGLHWSKPELGQVEYRGSKANNFVTVLLGGVQHRAECIVRDDTDPDPKRRYKTATPNVFDAGKGGYAVSPDGIQWTEISHPGISSGDEWNLTFDEREHLFLHYLKRRAAHGRAIWLTTSKDFADWSEPELILEADDVDQTHGAERIEKRLADSRYQRLLGNDPSGYNVDVYHMCPFRYESAYFGMPAFYHAVCPAFESTNTDGFHVAELASSRNLKDWSRLGDRQAFIEPSLGGCGAYDLTQIMSPAAAVIRGDELWFYYSGLKYRGLSVVPEDERRDLDEDSSAICLAVLRRDGFVSIDADEDGGTLHTEPFTLTGEHLLVNVDAADGELSVDVLDAAGEVTASSARIEGDRPSVNVAWERGDVGEQITKEISLRFNLRGAQLYSYWFE
jgi:hypothetical protein